VEFCPYQLFVQYLNKGQSIVVGGFLNLKDSLYKLCDTTRPNTKPTTLVAHIDERSRTFFFFMAGRINN
jgi:hypothetical protein